MAKVSITIFGNRRISTDLAGIVETIQANPIADQATFKVLNVDPRPGGNPYSISEAFAKISDVNINQRKWGAIGINETFGDKKFKEILGIQPEILIFIPEYKDFYRTKDYGGIFHWIDTKRNSSRSTIIVGLPHVGDNTLFSNYNEIVDSFGGDIIKVDSSLNHRGINDLKRIFVDPRKIVNNMNLFDKKGFSTDANASEQIKQKVFSDITAILNQINKELDKANPQPASTTTSETKKPPEKKDKPSTSTTSSGMPGGTTDTAATTPAGPPAETEEEKRERERKIITASKMRINEQAALMVNAPTLLYTKPLAGKDKELNEVPAQRQYANFATYRNGAMGTGGHIDFSKNVLKSQDHRYFLKDVPPHILSVLTPSIKIYKVFYPEEKMFSPNSEGFSWRIPFDEISVPYKAKVNSTSSEVLLTSKLLNPSDNEQKNDFKVQALDEILNGKSRFHGVGIKSFRYAYKGTNPAEINTNIEADLELYLQDVRDIVKEYEVEKNDANFFGQNIPEIKNKLKFSYADLIADVPARIKQKDPKLNKEKYNTDYYRIKIAVGYAVPPDDYLLKLVNGNTQQKEAILNAVKKAAVFLYLNPYNHDITFEENGAITLKIQYISAMTVQTSVINCMHIAKNSYSKLLESQKALESQLKEQTENIKNLTVCAGFTGKELEAAKNAEIKRLEPAIEKAKTELEMDKNSIYTEIFSRLTGIIDNGTPTVSNNATGKLSAAPTDNPQQHARSRVYEVVFDSEALGLTSKGQLDEKAKPYEYMHKLKKIHGYFLSEISEKDSSWFLTTKPIKSPVPTNVERMKSSAEKAEAALAARLAEPISSDVKPASKIDIQKLDQYTRETIQRQLNYIAKKRKIKFKEIQVDGNIGDKTYELAKQLSIVIAPDGNLYNSPQKTNLVSEDYYKNIPSEKIIEIQKKINEIIKNDTSSKIKQISESGKFDNDTMSALSTYKLIVSDIGDIVSSSDLSFSLSSEEINEYFDLETSRQQSELKLEQAKIDAEQALASKQYNEKIKEIETKLQQELTDIERAEELKRRADVLLAKNNKVVAASLKQLKSISKKIAIQIQKDLNSLAFYKNSNVTRLKLDGVLGGAAIEMANFVGVLITAEGLIVTKPPVEEKKQPVDEKQDSTKEGAKQEKDTGEEEQSSPETKQKASEIASQALVKAAGKDIKVQVPLTGPYEGKFSVKFVFLGDIIDVFCEVLDEIEFSQDRPKLILSNFELEIPNSVVNNVLTYTKETFNIADIPVSIEMLKTFLLERMIKPRASNYNLFTMITHLISDVVPPAISPRYFGTKSILNRSIRVGMLGFAVPLAAGNKDAILDIPADSKKFSGKIDGSKLKDRRVHDLIEINNNRNIGNYSVLYCSNQLPNLIKKNNGGLVQDEDSGIYHFYIGADRGIIKKISFSRNNTPFYKEAKSQSSQGIKSLGRLQEVYNVSVTMFGNNIYKPGDFFYVEPLFFSGKTAVDLQNKIGLGGYYQVIDVETTINVGSYETKINAVLYGRIVDNEVISEVEERACGDIREYNTQGVI